MGKPEKVMEKTLRGASDANIAFDDIRGMLLHLDFEERIRGSHHVYRKEGVEEKIANHAWYTFWYVAPTLPMFLAFPAL